MVGCVCVLFRARVPRPNRFGGITTASPLLFHASTLCVFGLAAIRRRYSELSPALQEFLASVLDAARGTEAKRSRGFSQEVWDVQEMLWRPIEIGVLVNLNSNGRPFS